MCERFKSYLDVLDLGTTAGLDLLIVYFEVLSGDILVTILNTSHATRFSRFTWRYCVPVLCAGSLYQIIMGREIVIISKSQCPLLTLLKFFVLV